MLEGLAAWVLNTYVGEYVEDLNTAQLSIALLQGAVELENLPLKKDALRSLGLPLQVETGFIGKITLQIPLRRLHSEPWVISMEHLYLVAGALKSTQYDEAKEKAAEAARKAKLLDALEAKWQIQKSDKPESSSWFSYGTSVLANILENLQLKVRDVHIRYEDATLNPSCPFAVGIVIKELSAESTDVSWMPKFVSRDKVDMMRKLVDLQNFAVYFDTHTTMVGSLSKSDMAEHEYILSPVSAKAKMKRCTTGLPLRTARVPRNHMAVTMETMAFSISEDQYYNMYLLLREFDAHDRRRKYHRWRPGCTVKDDARAWWRFAIDVKLAQIRERNLHCTCTFMVQRAHDIATYFHTYTSHLNKELLDASAKAEKARLEDELSFDTLKIVRELAYRKLKKEGRLAKAPTPDPPKSPGTPPQGDKTLLHRWFPGWGGWYGAQPAKVEDGTSSHGSKEEEDTESGEPPPKISKSEMEIEHDLAEVVEGVMGNADDDRSVLKRDAVFATLNFSLNSGSFRVLGVNTDVKTGERVPYSILELECSAISMLFESRPRTHGMKFGISVGSLLLLDKLTENSIFPCLVGSQNKGKFGSYRQTGIPGFQKSARVTPVTEDTTETLFELLYEKNPAGTSASYRFSIKTKPLDIVYNKTAFSRVREVFSTRSAQKKSERSELSIAAVARRRFEFLKRQTREELKNTIDQLLEGTEEVQIKRWDIMLDVAAPQIILPESFTDTNTGLVVVDLGQLKFYNMASITRENSSQNAVTNEDDFHTPMSTPPNEVEEGAEQQMDIDDLTQLNLTESEFYNKLYDKYSLELTDLQVMVGGMQDNWRHIHHRGSTQLHMLDRFSITLQLERRLIYSTDPQWPSVTVAGTLPHLTIHVNEQKIQTVNNCIKMLSQPRQRQPNVAPSSSSVSLTESSSGLAMDEPGETSYADSSSVLEEAEDKMREVLEDSTLLLTQFSINHLSLEIHSRDRAVAELQVSGVRANMTKRPFDTSVTLTVHSLLVVDALQTYGKDFELLMASHRNITLDSTSGSMRDSGATSPMVVSPRPSSPTEQLPPVYSSSSLQKVQDVVSRAFQALLTGNTAETMPHNLPAQDLASPILDSEALITLEFEMFSEKSPSNTNVDGPLHVANFQFNNLDIIANQETVMEILSFLRRTMPQSSRSASVPRPGVAQTPDLGSPASELPAHSTEQVVKPKLEVTAEFNRLSLLLMRLHDVAGMTVARKVATATMSCARLQATIDSSLEMTGSLGGFHVFDITPDAQRHQRVFSVGQEEPHLGTRPVTPPKYSAADMYKTANESMLVHDLDCDNKAFSYSFNKPLKRSVFPRSESVLCDDADSLSLNDNDCIKVSAKVASLCYTHSPKILFEVSQCVSEFKDYASSIAASIKNAATEVAKGIVAKRPDVGYNSIYGSSISLDMFGGNRSKLNQSENRIESEFLENTLPLEQTNIKSKIVIDASLETPVIVVPQSATSSRVLVARLGQISISNTEVKAEGQCEGQSTECRTPLGDTSTKKSDRIYMEARNINLYSVDIDKDYNPNTNEINLDTSEMYNDLYVKGEHGTPIMYDTTVQITMDHVVPEVTITKADDTIHDLNFSEHIHSTSMNESVSLQDTQPSLDFNAKIQTPIKLVLSKQVYEQILQTTDNMSYVEESHEQRDSDTSKDASGRSQSESQTDTDNSSVKEQSESEINTSSTTQHASTSSQLAKPFISKKVKFEVPLLSVELRGDFGEGEHGLVELQLHRFLLDYLKDNPATTNIELSLKSLVMEDLLEPPDSEHRLIMVSKEPKVNDPAHFTPRLFMSQSCPDSAIVAPVPVMPSSLPSSFHSNMPPAGTAAGIGTNHGTNQTGSILSPHSLQGAFIPVPRGKGKASKSKSPEPVLRTPPPMSTSPGPADNVREDNLVHISLLLVEKSSPEYTDKYNQTKRFIDVAFSCLDTKINLQTWVVLLDFLGLGAKIHDLDTLQGTAPTDLPPTPVHDVYTPAVVNSEVNLKVENLTVILNKPEYEFARASVSQLGSHISLREGNFHMRGQLGHMQLLDQSPGGQLYRERFLTVGQHAMEFDVFKFGVPDPWLKREYDMKLKLRMASVRYTHTNRFQAELLGFVQHFLQLQDVLGRMRAASAGKRINEAAFHQPRLLLDVEAGSPIILVPHSSRTTDVLVADLGTLSIKNIFRFDGDDGTFSAAENKSTTTTPTAPGSSAAAGNRQTLSHSTSQTSQKSASGVILSRSNSHAPDAESRIPHPLTQSLFDELLPPRINIDPMTESIYGGLDSDLRSDADHWELGLALGSSSDIQDPTDMSSEGSSVDPSSPASLSFSLSGTDSLLDHYKSVSLSSPTSLPLNQSADMSPFSDATLTERSVFANQTESRDGGDTGMKRRCLLDVMQVKLTDMDLYSAERVEKRDYKGTSLKDDLEFPSCVIQRTGTKLVNEKCLLDLTIERNLEGDISHSVPDWQVRGALSSVHCCLDTAQYRLIRGLLDHNLGEKVEMFKKDLMTSMQDPMIQTVLSGDVWCVISMSIDLTNVSLELLRSHDHAQRVSLAKLDFIRSRLSFDSYSDQSKETDLVSHEILAWDTRFRDVAINQRPSVFEKILQPSASASPDSLQLELHFRATPDGTRFLVLLNDMKLLCSFDWLVSVKEFIATKPENPFLPDRSFLDNQPAPVSPSSSASGSRTTSPLTTSGGIITKRGPQVEQSEVPFELKLNVTETQFVVVEDLASWDSNAVILKCTAVLSYRPKAPDKLLSCTLQSLEVFSCCVTREEETAMSIVDPLTITVELNANPLPDARPSSSSGLLECKELQQRQLLLEVGFNTMNIRLSYHDMRMFLAIMNSLPKQALQASQQSQTNLPSPIATLSEHKLEQLESLGFSRDDCERALQVSGEVTDTAAIWLTHNAKVVKPQKDGLKLTTIELRAHSVCLCLIDDCQDADVPLAELHFNSVNFNLKFEPSMEGRATFQISGDYYNRALSGWEPMLEHWRCHTDWKHYQEGKEKKFAIQISAPDVLNVNLTKTMMELFNKTKVKWTEDYYTQGDDSGQKESSPCGAVRRRQLFTPYVLRNQTGSPLWFLTVTKSPSSVAGDRGQRIDDAYIQATDWRSVPPNDEAPFHFSRIGKIRHKKTHALSVNQLVVKVEGWQRLSPVSVDKVGVYFRNTLPDRKQLFIKVNDRQPARVVFDVSLEGSAQKVITLRSALNVCNRLDGPIEVKMENPIIPGRFDYLTINTDQQKPVPMTFVTSKLWVKPSDWLTDSCDEPIIWENVAKPGERSDSLRTCELSGTQGAFRFCVAVRRERYPEEATIPGLMPMPGHTITIVPPVTVVNLLPQEMHYYLKHTDISGSIRPGQQAQLHAADLSSSLYLGIKLENFPRCDEVEIPPNTSDYDIRLPLHDYHGRMLKFNVSVRTRIGGALKVSISSAFWLVNKSGLPLIFGQDQVRAESAGQFEEHELARSVTPLLFNFTDSNAPYLCTMRLGKAVHGPSASPQWCSSFSLDSGTSVRKLHVVPREGNRPNWVYNIGIEVRQGRGKTNIVTFAPRFQLDNQSGHKLAIAQRHLTNREAVLNPSSHLTALPKCKLPFHWPRLDLDQLLCVKALDLPGLGWSGGFKIDKIDSFSINMRDCQKDSVLLKVEVMLQGPTYYIVFTDAEEMPPPFQIDNRSEVPVMYHQSKTENERLRTTIKPHTVLPYAWDEPTLDPYLTMSVSSGTTATYNLDKLGEGEQLCYTNFIYIVATATFPRPGSAYTELQHKELVLDCQHEHHVVFKKREAGKRSQLWRMTGDGMLENEGLALPTDPRRQAVKSSQRYVLDIADIALQPSKPVPLMLKKADERRRAKQTWKFTADGRLCCSTGNFCLQSISGIEGLQNGAIAVLGPGPDLTDGSPVPSHMQMTTHKLYPGSGCLTVRMKMDGPTRVVQIADVQQRSIIKLSGDGMEDWEIYEESLNHQTNVKCRKPRQKNIEVSVNLKGGIGVSLVNSIHEDLLYLTLKNITVFYLANSSSVTMELSVANIQADNQLLGAQRPVALFVTHQSKRDVPENTPALHVAAHRIPNTSWNAEIFKHLIISMKKLTIQLEELLLWKLIQFSGHIGGGEDIARLEEQSDHLQKTLVAATSVKAKRYYFGTLRINLNPITLSVLTTSRLSADLLQVKRSMTGLLVQFENASVELDQFNRNHSFETRPFIINEIKTHFSKELRKEAAHILGSVDFLGNPLGLISDVMEGFEGLIQHGNVGGLVKNIAHGVSNSTAKVVSSISHGMGQVYFDRDHNKRREEIMNNPGTGGGTQMKSGLKGFLYGVKGGVTGIWEKPREEVSRDGLLGIVPGILKGAVGLVVKPTVGVLDLASGAAGAIRETSRRSSSMPPARVRPSRCCRGPGDLLPTYSKTQAEAQAIMYKLDYKKDEFFIALEMVRCENRDRLYALITSVQVYFLSCLEPHHASITLNVDHRSVAHCRARDEDGRHYIQLNRKEEETSSGIKIRCDKKTIAQKVAQQIDYAKNLFDEQKQTVHVMADDQIDDM